MEFIKVDDVSNIGKCKVFKIKDIEIAVFEEKDEYYAIENSCPHQRLGLCGGAIKDKVISCPHHGWEFNLDTGKGVVMPYDIRVFKTKVENNSLFIEV